MGISYRFDENAILRIEVADPLDSDQIRAAVDALLADPQLRPGVDILSDHSRLAGTASTEMVRDVLPLLARLGERLGSFRCAIVAPEDASLALFFDHRFDREETFMTFAPYLAVYDDVDARELSGNDWSSSGQGTANYFNELIGPDGYIATFADRIHFNRYTGVAMK